MPTYNSSVFDRFDILAAYNVFSQYAGWDNYTRGIQSRLRTLGYKPSRSETLIEGLSDNAGDILLALTERRLGESSAERLRRIMRPEAGDVVINLDTSDDDPFQITAWVSDVNANRWADAMGSLDGGTWESTESDGSFVYDILQWSPELIDTLLAQGYRLALSNFREPSEEEIEIAHHASHCDACEGDYRAAERHSASAA